MLEGLERFLGCAWDELLDAVYPPLCPLCGERAPEGRGCAVHRLPSGASGKRCGVCGLRLAPCLPDGERCAACRRSSPGFRRLLALADYRADAGVRPWILALKHGGRRDLAPILGRHLAAFWRERVGAAALRGALLVPVPLHPLRRLERGFDQARSLAASVAEASGVPWRAALARRRWTPPQGSAGSRSRTANVSGAFRLRRRMRGELAGRRVWLVDDVVTSGATAAASAAELRRGGAAEVAVLCLARVEIDRHEFARASRAGALPGGRPAPDPLPSPVP